MKRHTTHLVIPVFAETADALRETVRGAREANPDFLEFRLDLCGPLFDEDVRSVIAAVGAPVRTLLTFRSAAEGGAGDEPSQARLERLIELAPWADGVDVELATWRAFPDSRQPLVAALSAPKPSGGAVDRRILILSVHDFTGRPPSLQKSLLACVDTAECDVVKLAWQARTVRDCFEAFEIMRSGPKPVIAIAMGHVGSMTRILAPKFGAFAGYASAGPNRTVAAGQLPAATLKSVFRWEAIDRSSEVYGVVGHPVAHSLSPATHNSLFDADGRNAVYVPLDVAPAYEAFKALMVEIRDRSWLDFRGLSVTLPHKEFAFRYLCESEAALDQSARRIGAVNTIRIDPGGGVHGSNTDIDGARALIRTAFPSDSVRGKRALVLGAGGAARAVTAACLDAGMNVVVANRTDERAARLASDLGAETVRWLDRTTASPHVIVNCTSVGMLPDASGSPWPDAQFAGVECVIDTVYRPVETRLLREARAAGCRVVNGLVMFAAQAARQYEFWTGRKPDGELCRRAVQRALERAG